MIEYFIKPEKNYAYEIILFLWQNQSKQYSLKNLQNHFHISRTIVLNSLEKLKSIAKKYPEFHLELHNSFLKASFSSNFLVNKVYIDLLKQSFTYNFFETLYLGNFKTLDIFAQEHFTTTRTIQRQIRKLNELLQEYSLSLSLKSQSIIIGEEYRIRHFFFMIFWHVLEEESVFLNQDYLAFKKFAYFFQLAQSDLKKLFIFLLITRHRLSKGHKITALPDRIKKIRHPFISLELFKKELKNNIGPFTQEEICFLYYVFTVLPS
ncbi:MAG: helix-turn-helix domain-containing protein, partial [Streptococcaceae bacterium]|nr:helix-turn-helix domain-containing protein [Streptococcaceae bacterium]